jgi:hypothetical protein
MSTPIDRTREDNGLVWCYAGIHWVPRDQAEKHTRNENIDQGWVRVTRYFCFDCVD